MIGDPLAPPPPEGPEMILVHAQLAENIGTAGRALANCALDDRLRLVAPRDGWPNPAAYPAASGADWVLDCARLYPDTRAATADLTWIAATTARPRHMAKPVLTPREAAIEARARIRRGERVGFLFGGERAGLTNDDVALAHVVVTVPLNPAFSSLNLAQSVLLVGYEWYQTDAEAAIGRFRALERQDPPAPAEEVHFLFDRLEGLLQAQGFFTTEALKPMMVRSLRNMIWRMEPSAQDLRTFHGVISSLIGSFRRRDPG